MATRIVLVCDIGGAQDDDDDPDELVVTEAFAFDGTAYEIDVCGRHRNRLRGVLGEYARYARPVTSSPRRRGGGKSRR